MTIRTRSYKGGGREAPKNEFQEFRAVEVQRAALDLATKRATGPDGIPAEIFRGLPTPREHLEVFPCDILKDGNLPAAFRTLYIIPLDKKTLEPRLRRNKRPIALIRIMAKILEGLIYNRLIADVEPRLPGNQYGYRRARGTEFHIMGLYDFAARSRARGKLVFPASVDV